MNPDFEGFYQRTLIQAKAHADVFNWMWVGLVVYIILQMVSIPDCQRHTVFDEVGFGEAETSLCESVYVSKVTAIAWFIFSGLRILLLSSKAQAGPILRLFGLRVVRRDGQAVDILSALRVAVIEWLPFHLFGLYIACVI